MLKAFVEKSLRRQEEITGEPTDFLRDIYEAAPGGFWRFALFVPMSRYSKRLPIEAYAVARIAAVHAEDCGPCLQTVVNMASSAGVPVDILRAAVMRDLGAMDERTRTVFEFAEAIAARDFSQRGAAAADRRLVGQGRRRRTGARDRQHSRLPDRETGHGLRTGLQPRGHRP